MQYPETRQAGSLRRCGLLVLVILTIAGCDSAKLPTASGGEVDWGGLRGQWVLVNYWAEWCKPCREEIPELNALDRSDNITVLGVNFDSVQGAVLEELGQTMGITYTLLNDDPGPGFGWQTPIGLPATFIVDPQGTLIETRFGPQTEEQLKALIAH